MEIPTMEALPRAKVMRRTARQMTGMSPTRRRTPCAWAGAVAAASAPGHSSGRVLSGEGPAPSTSQGRLLGRLALGGCGRGRGRAAKLSTRSTRAPTPSSHIAGPAASSSSSFPGTVITGPPVGGHRGVLLVLSAARSSPRHPFCPLASLTCLLRRGTRKGSRASYLFFSL